MLVNATLDKLIDIYKENGPVCICENTCFWQPQEYCRPQRLATVAYRLLSKKGVRFHQSIFTARMHALEGKSRDDFDTAFNKPGNITRPTNERRL